MRQQRATGFLRVRNLLFGLAAAVLAVGAAPQSGPTPIEAVKLDREVDFNKDILPIFKTNCLACHNASDAEGEVVLETPESIRKGGSEGPIVVAGKGMESSLLKVVSRRAKPYMPPRKNKVGAKALTSRELGLLKLWIDQGAKGTGVAAIPPPTLKAAPSNWNPIYAVALDSQGQVIACGRAGRLYIYNVAAGKLAAQPVDPALSKIVSKGQPGLAHLDAVHSMTFSADGSRLATGGYRAIKIWRRELTAQTAKVDLGEARALALSPDGTRLAAASGKEIRIFDLSNGKVVATAKGHEAAVTSVGFSSDGKLLLSGSDDQTARSWNAADGKPVGVVKTPQPVTAVAWLAENKQIATGEKDNVIRLWTAPAPAKAEPKKEEKKDGKKEEAKKEEKKPEAPKPLKELKGHGSVVRVLMLDPSNPKRLLSGSNDTRLRHWDLERGSQIREFNHGSSIVAIGASADGKRFASVASNKSAKLWNGENGQQIAELRTDGSARRSDQHAQAYLGFVNNEVKYREGVVKSSEDAKKKEQEEVKKSTDALPAANKAVTDSKAAFDKAARDRGAADTRMALALEETTFSKARAETVAQALGRTANDGTLKEFAASKAEADKAVAAASKVAADAKAKADAAGKAAAAAKQKNDADKKKADADKKAADKAVADAEKAVPNAQNAVKAAAQAVTAAKPKLDAAVKAFNEAKAKADQAAEALKKAGVDDKKKKEAEAAKNAADEALKNAGDDEKKKKEAEAAKKAADEALKKIADDEKKRKEAEAAKKTADEALKKAEAAKTAAEQASKKAETDKQKAEAALAGTTKKRDEAKAKVAAAAKALERANAAAELATANAAKAAADLEASKVNKALQFAQIRADYSNKMKLFVETALKFKKSEGDKAAADKALAEMEKAAQTAQNACNTHNQALAAAKPKLDAAVNAFNQAKAKADQAAEALKKAGVDDKKKKEAEAAKNAADEALKNAGDDEKKKKEAEAAKKAADEALKKIADGEKKRKEAEAAKKAADEALKKAEAAKAAAEAATQKAEAAKKAADKALADSTKKRDDQRNRVNQANQALAQAKGGADGAKRTLEQEKGQADQAVRNAESARQREERNQQNAKRNENEKKTAWDVAKLNLNSAKRRIEKAHEGVKKSDQQIQEAKDRLATEKEHQKKTDADRKKAAEALKNAQRDLLAAAVSADGAFLVVGAGDGRLHAFGGSGRGSGVIEGHGKPVLAMRFLPDGSLVSIAADGSVRRGSVEPAWKLERAIKPADDLKPPVDRIVSLAFSPDGTLLASGGGTPSREGELILWNVADGKMVRKIVDAHSDTVYDVNFSRDGSMLASCAADKFAKVWDVKTGKRLNSFEGHTHHVLGVGWNRTGRSLATAGADNVIKVWDRTTGKQKRTISGFAKQVTAVRYIGYGETFAVSAGGTQVRLVGENGRTARNFDTQGAFMYAVSVSSDGRVLAGGGLDSVLRLWRTDNGQSLGTFAPPKSN